MALFTGVFVNKLDKKGRVSVPAPFRDGLKPHTTVHAFPSRAGVRAIECCGPDRMQELQQSVGTFEPEDAAGLRRAMQVFSKSHELAFDPEGRITIPPSFITLAGLDGQVTFAGVGRIFQIWEPAQFDAFLNGEAAQ